jgi:hypothetical protein
MWLLIAALLPLTPPASGCVAAADGYAGAAPIEAAAKADAPAPPLRLELNLAAYRLEAYGPGGRLRSYPVAIGSTRYRTPVGDYAVRSVELNPWWHPPDSEWARNERITPPGPGNPMGRAKLHFGALYFLHGTPHSASIGTAASHGCVRMRNADVLDLARLVLSIVRPDVGDAEVARAEANPGRTRRWALNVTVPLAIVYRVAEVRDDALEIHPDVYRRHRGGTADLVLRALAEAGVPPQSLNAARLDSALAAGRRRHVRVPLEELATRPEAEPPLPVIRLPDDPPPPLREER